MNETSTGMQLITCGVPQGSILGALLFLVYVNNLPKSSKALDIIMFADDTNLFHKHKNISKLLSNVNDELNKLYNWFKANKLHLNLGKTKHSLSNKSRRSDDLSLKLPAEKLNENENERIDSIKFLGILIDQKVSWKQHLRYLENKVARDIGLFYKVKSFLNKASSLAVY